MINILRAICFISLIICFSYTVYYLLTNPEKLYVRKSGKFFDWKMKFFFIWILGCLFYPYIFDWDTYMASLPWRFAFLEIFVIVSLPFLYLDWRLFKKYNK